MWRIGGQRVGSGFPSQLARDPFGGNRGERESQVTMAENQIGLIAKRGR